MLPGLCTLFIPHFGIPRVDSNNLPVLITEGISILVVRCVKFGLDRAKWKFSRNPWRVENNRGGLLTARFVVFPDSFYLHYAFYLEQMEPGELFRGNKLKQKR